MEITNRSFLRFSGNEIISNAIAVELAPDIPPLPPRPISLPFSPTLKVRHLPCNLYGPEYNPYARKSVFVGCCGCRYRCEGDDCWRRGTGCVRCEKQYCCRCCK